MDIVGLISVFPMWLLSDAATGNVFDFQQQNGQKSLGTVA